MLISRLLIPLRETEAQKAERLKVEKKVCILFKGSLFDDTVNKQKAAINAYLGSKFNAMKFRDIVRLFLSKTLSKDTADQIRTYLAKTKSKELWTQRH